jgi:hypothetical protein
MQYIFQNSLFWRQFTSFYVNWQIFISVGTRSNSVWPYLFLKRLTKIFFWISDFKFELSIKYWIKWILEWPFLYLFKKNSDQKPIPDRSDRSNRVFWVFWSVFFWNKYKNGHSSIHFIQNLMPNSNLKSDIQKNI